MMIMLLLIISLTLFYENLSSLVDKHAPVRKMTIKEVRLHAKPWVSQKMINPIQAGVFWNHIRLGVHIVSPLFLLYLWFNYNQSWQDGTLGKNLSKAIKMLLTSSTGGKYDVIKPFLVSF